MRLLAQGAGRYLRSCSRVRIKRQALVQLFSSASARCKESEKSSSLPSYPGKKPFELTKPPSIDWNIGDGANYLYEGLGQKFKTWDFGVDVQLKNGYRLLTSAIVPRPIAFVSTLSADGIPNLAPFSYFSMVSHNPPLLSVSFSLSQRRPKDTRENILSTKKFVVNMISDHFVEAANSTSVEAPAEVDEWIVSGLTTTPSENGWPARVRESSVCLECELYFSKDIPISQTDPTIGTTLVLGLIKKAYVREAVLAEDGETIDPRKLRAVARLGGLAYATIGHGFDLPRPSWKRMKDSYDVISHTEVAKIA